MPGDVWGLSEMGVGGNDLLRSSEFRLYSEYISASRFEVTIDDLPILIPFRGRGEVDIAASVQAARSDSARLVQLFLEIFVGMKILQRSAVRVCTITCEPRSALNSCETGGRISGIPDVSLHDSKGDCSFSNSTLAFALSGSSRRGSTMLLYPISCTYSRLNALGSGDVGAFVAALQIWVTRFCRDLRTAKRAARVASRRSRAAPTLTPTL